MTYSVKDAIKKRISVRTYNGESLRPEDRQKLEDYMKTIENPFGIPVEFRFLDAKQHGLSSPVLVGENLYVAGKVARDSRAEEAFGYSFEQFVLYAASLGIGTVWIAGTMDRPTFEKAVELDETEVMPAVTPVGYPAAQRSVREVMMRKGIKADERFAFETLFFDGSFDKPLAESEAGELREVLEMVRLAPSAVNKQPWRVVVCGDTVHFYEKKSKGFAKEGAMDMQRIDVGIAMAHFALAADENGMKGQFVEGNPDLAHDTDTEYIMSYRMEVKIH